MPGAQVEGAVGPRGGAQAQGLVQLVTATSRGWWPFGEFRAGAVDVVADERTEHIGAVPALACGGRAERVPVGLVEPSERAVLGPSRRHAPMLADVYTPGPAHRLTCLYTHGILGP